MYAFNADSGHQTSFMLCLLVVAHKEIFIKEQERSFRINLIMQRKG
ncbi:hypothetical protein AAZX31_03G052200 [Glycine max]